MNAWSRAAGEEMPRQEGENPIYHRITLAPQVKPAPKATRTI